MKQILNNPIRQKKKTNKEIEKIYCNIGRNEEERNENKKEIETIERVVRNRKKQK